MKLGFLTAPFPDTPLADVWSAVPKGAATRGWSGGSEGTPGARSRSNSRRSTGSTSAPRMSICSSTVRIGSPAWSTRNSWRW